MRDIIHIGYPRTASTWFQNNLFPKVQNYTFIPRKIIQESLIHPLPLKYNRDWPKEQTGINGPFLLSEEMITGKIRAGSVNLHFLEFYANRLKETFNDPVVIIFLRSQPDSIFSFYNLYIRKGGTYSFSGFLRQDIHLQESLLFSKAYFCYDIPLQILTNTFGREAVRIYFYEEFSSDPKVFVERFLKELNLEADLNDCSYSRINSGYSPFRLGIKRFTNRFTSRGVPFKHYFFTIPHAYNFIAKGSSMRNKVPAGCLKQMDVFFNEFAASNTKLITDYKLNTIKELNYPL